MATVHVLPSGITFEVEPSESVLAGACRNGLYWPTQCNGNGKCTVCIFTVIDGAEALSPVEVHEAEGLAVVLSTMPGDPAGHRLACQARAAGSVTLRKVGVRRRSR